MSGNRNFVDTWLSSEHGRAHEDRPAPSRSQGSAPSMTRRHATLMGSSSESTGQRRSVVDTRHAQTRSSRGRGSGSRPHYTERLLQERHPTPPRPDGSPPMPPVRPVPTPLPQQGPSAGGAGPSGSTPRQSPPARLFLCPFVPAIPEFDDRGRQIFQEDRPRELPWEDAYFYRPFDPEYVGLWSARCANKQYNDAGHVVNEPAGKRRTRGPVNASTHEAATHGRMTQILATADGKVIHGKDTTTRYVRLSGMVVRDRVPMLWADWDSVPLSIRSQAHNAMTEWFDVAMPCESWANAQMKKRYAEWKNELSAHYKTYHTDLGRGATPHELRFREYEWLWLVAYFGSSTVSKISETNSGNRKCNTNPHHGGSRNWQMYAEIAKSQRVERPLSWIHEKMYPDLTEERARVDAATDAITSRLAREQLGENAPDEEVEQFASTIDVLEPIVATQVYHESCGTGSNHYYQRGSGSAGDGILKNTPAYSSSSRVSSRTRDLEEQLQRTQRDLDEQRRLVEEAQRREESRDAAQDAMYRWMHQSYEAQRTGQPLPPPPQLPVVHAPPPPPPPPHPHPTTSADQHSHRSSNDLAGDLHQDCLGADS